MDIQKWIETGLLKDLSKDKIENAAHVLEGQKLFLENNQMPSMFNLIIIPVIRRMFNTSNFTHSTGTEVTITNIDWVGEKLYGLGPIAEYVMELTTQIENWLKENNKTSFNAIGLFDIGASDIKPSDTKIAIYGLSP